MKILFVAQAVSIHTARWIAQLGDQGWDLHLFDMLGSFPHPELAGVTEYSLLFPRRIPVRRGEPHYGHPFFMRHGWDPFPISLVGFFLRRLFTRRVRRLASLIEHLRPDVIHSFELQTEGYHLPDAARLLGGSLGAPWIVNTWGSDIFYFQRFPEHLEKIKAILRMCNYLIPDCARDVSLARLYGFSGEVPLILPGAGGYQIEEMRRHMAPGKPSGRRIVMIKGYEGWAGRAKQVLAALEPCADLLAGYEIIVYS
ncbi:MAG: glycosyltransferase, partial [Anaerolineales bacterium]